MMHTKLKLIMMLGIFGAGCTSPEPTNDATEGLAGDRADDALDEADALDQASAAIEASHRRQSVRKLHAGAGLLPLAITADDHVFFQEGQALYVTGIARGATASQIATIPDSNTAFIFTTGKVAFIWTNPDYTSPSYGVSPLMIWTARHGARLVSEDSPVGTLTTAADRAGLRVVFPSGARQDGTVGDIVEATTDGRERTTLLSGVQTDYSNGPCRPLAAFLGLGLASYPAVAACAGTDTTSTLSIFRRGARRDLTGLANPPRLFADPERRRLLTAKASEGRPSAGPPLLVTESAVEQLEDSNAGYGFFTPDGAANYFVLEADGSLGVHRTKRGSGPPIAITGALAGLHGAGFGSNSLLQPVTSRRGRWLAIGTQADPQTGLLNVAVADLRAEAPRVTVIDEAQDNYAATPVAPFTSDGEHVLYGKYDINNGTSQMYAAALATGARRTLSDANAATLTPAAGSLVVVADDLAFNSANPALSTADLRVVDAATGASRLIAEQANLTSFVSHDGRHLIYITDNGPSPGLHVAPAR